MPNCNQTLTGYKLTCEDKQVKGGLKTNIYITLRSNVDFDNCTLDADNNVYTAFALVSGAKFYKYEFAKQSCVLNSEFTYDGTTGEKSFATNNLTMLFRRMDAAKRLAITSLMNSELFVVVEDANGTAYALGVEEAVTSTSGSFTTGQSRTDANAATIIFTDTTADLPLQISSNAMADIIAAVAA